MTRSSGEEDPTIDSGQPVFYKYGPAEVEQFAVLRGWIINKGVVRW